MNHFFRMLTSVAVDSLIFCPTVATAIISAIVTDEKVGVRDGQEPQK